MIGQLSKFPKFPPLVDERAGRVVAGGVVVLSLVALWTTSTLLTGVVAGGFALRVLAGPRYSPLAIAARRVVGRTGGPRLTPGPPKRFAQGIGLVFSLTALAMLLAGADGAARVVLAMLAGAAGLEAAFGFCLGCRIFAGLMTAGVIPASVCEACNDLRARDRAVADPR